VDGVPPADVDGDALAGPMLQLLVWMSPAFPTGAFAYSQGLEWMAERRVVTDRATLADWLLDLARHGALRNDLVLLAAAWRATAARDAEAFRQVAELALALQPSAERRLEAVTQGNAFAKAIADAWPTASVDWLADAWTGDLALPVAVGASTAGHGVPLASALSAFAVSTVTNLVSAAIRLSVVGQTDGQRVIAGLLSPLRDAATAAAASTLDDLGAATFAADLASIRHETQYTRLFRS